MSIPGSSNLMLFGGAAAYQIDQSLRFNSADSAYLNRTPTQGTTDSRISTTSVWVKRAAITTSNLCIFGCSPAGSLFGEITISNHKLQIQNIHSSGGGSQHQLISNDLFRDGNAWYHIVVMYDTTQATASNRTKVYVNNRQITSWGTETYLGQNFDPFINSGSYARGIGKLHASYSYYFDGYLAEFHHVDGQSLTPSSFGETDLTTGAWIPKRYTGSHGLNGFYLKFDPSATNGIGHDHSSSGNNWTANNFTTSGTGTDVMSDTPTTNYATLNPLAKANIADSTITDGNLGFRANNACLTTFSLPSGKWYCEFTQDYREYGSAYGTFGVYRVDAITFADGNARGATSASYVYKSDGNKVNNNSSTSYGASWTTGDTIGLAIDMDGGTITFYKNNTSQGQAFSGITAPVVVEIGATGGTIGGFLNFGQRAFAYTPPTGYKALNTANLPEPTIKDGGKYFNTVLYTGNSSNNHAITGVGFQPDFVWIKDRNVTGHDHVLTDAVRGNTKVLRTNTTGTEYTQTDAITSFDSDGFTLGDDNSVGEAGNFNTNNPHVAWCWDAGGTGSSNTAGSITSTVSANASAGFSIVTYTGNGVSNATVGHGLGVVPALVINKVRTGSTGPWYVKHKNLASGKNIYLDQTAAETALTGSGGIGDLTSSTTFTCANGSNNNENTNASGRTYVAYCFSEVAGYSKFGSYTGNGSSDGPFVFCGFRPAWVMIKRTNDTQQWMIYDTTRNTYNVANLTIFANTSDSESTQTTNIVDVLSNGFKLKDAGNATNTSGSTYIFAAFAELPFKYANAR